MPTNPPTLRNFEITFHGGPAPTYTINCYGVNQTTQSLLEVISQGYQEDRMILFDDCAIAVREFHYVQVKEIPS